MDTRLGGLIVVTGGILFLWLYNSGRWSPIYEILTQGNLTLCDPAAPADPAAGGGGGTTSVINAAIGALPGVLEAIL